MALNDRIELYAPEGVRVVGERWAWGFGVAFREHKSQNPCADKRTAECADFGQSKLSFRRGSKTIFVHVWKGDGDDDAYTYTYTVGIKPYFRAPTPNIYIYIYRSCRETDFTLNAIIVTGGGGSKINFNLSGLS